MPRSTLIVGIYLVYQNHLQYVKFSVLSPYSLHLIFLEILLCYVTGKEETSGSH
jgi:hypothetical protein